MSAGLPRPPVNTMAVDVHPWELRVGDVVPFSDHVGRPVIDIRAVSLGQRARCLTFADLPPVTVHGRIRVYRRCELRVA